MSQSLWAKSGRCDNRKTVDIINNLFIFNTISYLLTKILIYIIIWMIYLKILAIILWNLKIIKYLCGLLIFKRWQKSS